MNTLSGKSHGRMRKYYYSCTAHFSTIIVPKGKKQARKCPFYRLLRAFENYSNSTKTNAFCLGIILCNVSRSFDYLIYPYYPAYTS